MEMRDLRCGALVMLPATGGGRPRTETSKEYFGFIYQFIDPVRLLFGRAGGPSADSLATRFVIPDVQVNAYADRHCPRAPCREITAVAAGAGYAVAAWKGVLSILTPPAAYHQLVGPPTAPNAIAVDDRYVYWAVDAPDKPSGELGRNPIAGGPRRYCSTMSAALERWSSIATTCTGSTRSTGRSRGRQSRDPAAGNSRPQRAPSRALSARSFAVPESRAMAATPEPHARAATRAVSTSARPRGADRTAAGDAGHSDGSPDFACDEWGGPGTSSVLRTDSRKE